MNRSYRTVFNPSLGGWQVVSETATARGKASKAGASARVSPPNRRPLVQALGSALLLMAAAAPAVRAQTYTGTYNWGSGNLTVGTGGTYTSIVSTSGSAVYATGSLGTLTNSGTISSGGSSGNNYAILNAGTIGVLSNSGTISAPLSNGVGLYNIGKIGTLLNSGVITGGGYALYNVVTIGTLINAGFIAPSGVGITIVGGGISSPNLTVGSPGAIGTAIDAGLYNSVSITGIANSGAITDGAGLTITDSPVGSIGTLIHAGIYNDAAGTIGTLSNSGAITSSSGYGIDNYGVVNGVSNTGSISSLMNNSGGTINGATSGISNASGGMVGMLTNHGTISGNGHGLLNAGTLGTLTNSGLIVSGGTAIFNGGSIGNFTNSGTIAGTIRNTSGVALSINGGSGAVFGTLTGSSGGIGAGAVGSIVSTPNLIFGSGNQLLNDNISINAGAGLLTNAGTVQVDNPVTISGNYAQGSGSVLLIGVTSPVFNGNLTDNGYGRLVVNGNATLDNSTVTVKSAGYSLAQGQRYVAVAATGSLSTAGATYSASGYSVMGSTQTDSSNAAYTDLVLTLGGAGSSSSSSGTGSAKPLNYATTRNAATVLNALFNYGGTAAAMLGVFNPAAALDTPGAANQGGAQLSPAAAADAVVHGSLAAFGTVQDAAGNRLDALRLARAGGSGIATGEAGLNSAAWGRLFGGQASQGERDGISGYHAYYSGLMLGGDTQVRPSWRVGGLFSYTHTNVNSDGDNSGSGASVNAYGLTAYAGYDGHPWYVNLTAGAARQLYSTTRTISYTGFNGTAYGAFKGTLYTATAEAGYPLAAGDGVLTPLAGLRYSALTQDGYTESGGNGAALALNGRSYSSIKSELGLKYERSYTTRYGELNPFVQLSWNHEFRNTPLTTSASFAADTTGSTAFATQGARPMRDTAALSLGVTLLRGNKLSLMARYTLEGARGYTAQTGDLTLRWRF